MKVAFIGKLGHQGYALGRLSHVEGCELVALARGEEGEDIDGLIGENSRKRYGDPAVYDDYREMLDKEKPDIVSIAGPWHLHAEMSIEALQRDVNVICEKPIAFTLEELAAVKRAHAASQADIIGQHGMRYQANFYAGCKALKEGVIGRPIMVTSQKSYGFSLQRPHFYKQRETYGSTLCWVAVHALDWTYWMVGGFETIYAAHTTIGNWDYGTCESSGVIAFTLDQGGQGCINFDFLKAHKDPVRQDRARIAGEKGVMEIREDKTWVVTHDREPYELDLPEEAPFFDEWVASLRGEGACELTAEDTFEVTRLGLLARESADTNTLIRPAERTLA